MTNYSFWFDAKIEAGEASLGGFAWIVNSGTGGVQSLPYTVVAGEGVEDAPLGFLAEFKDGVEQ